MGEATEPKARALDLTLPYAVHAPTGGGPCGAPSSSERRPAWSLHPERIAFGGESGIAAAIWGRRGETPTEYRRIALEHFHVVTVRLQSFVAERWLDGRLIHDQETAEGTSSFTFAGTEPRSVIYGSWRSLQIYLPSAFLIDIANEVGLAPLDADRVDCSTSYDPVLHDIGRKFVTEIEQAMPGSRLQIDALGTMICVHLLRRAGDGSIEKLKARGGLASWQLKRAMECVAERLGESVTLASLAEEVGLSQYHFARAFKQSTGQSPHQYLMHCRLDRAKELLVKSDASVAEIAASVGYSEPTQLSRLFQTELGVSPTRYRRAATARGPTRGNPAAPNELIVARNVKP